MQWEFIGDELSDVQPSRIAAIAKEWPDLYYRRTQLYEDLLFRVTISFKRPGKETTWRYVLQFESPGENEELVFIFNFPDLLGFLTKYKIDANLFPFDSQP